jgi:ribosomal protein S18 acetylase RimI-like enzyme
MPKQIIIREVTIEKAIAVHRTIVEFDDPNAPEEYFKSGYGDDEKLILVAYLKNQAVGYIIAHDKYKDGSIYCWMAGVDPRFRKRGILKALMSYLSDWASDHGYQKIKIKTRNNKRAMLSYLIKYGFNFTEVQSQPNILDNRIEAEINLVINKKET